MYYSKAMTSTVQAWLTGHKRKITIYKTDGELLWVGGTLIGITAPYGQKVVVSKYYTKLVKQKAVTYARKVATWEILMGVQESESSRMHALWSMVERTKFDLEMGKYKFHFITTAPPLIYVLNEAKPTNKPYKPKKSTLVNYCPNCTEDESMKGWKHCQWGKGGPKLGFPTAYNKNCVKCGTKMVPMTRQGAKLYWMVNKKNWEVYNASSSKIIQAAIDKGM